jgi:phasin family protein
MAAATEALKVKTEQYTAAGAQVFKDAVEKSLTALNDMNAQSKQNLEAVVASVTAATKGAETLGAHAIAYSKKTMQDHATAARSLGAARSVQEVVELQTAWAKSAMEAYMAELTSASEIVAASVKETMTPLNARVTAAVEKFQAAK